MACKQKAYFIVGIWLSALITGFTAIEKLEWGTIESQPLAVVQSEEERRLPTMELFLHPHCPCSIATVSMLTSFVERFANHCHNVIYLYCAELEPDTWSIGLLHSRISEWPNATIIFDHGGQKAEECGARISGTVHLRSADGKLRFAGGVTPGRGRTGPSFGMEQLISQMENEDSPMVNVPVFGCELFDHAMSVRK